MAVDWVKWEFGRRFGARTKGETQVKGKGGGMMRAWEGRLGDHALVRCLFGWLLLCVLLLAGAVPSLALGSFLLLWLCTWGFRVNLASGLGVPFWLLAGLGLFSALQAVPLPLGFVELVSPHSAEIWRLSTRPFGAAEPTWCPLSLAPSASLHEAGKFMTYAVLFALSSALAKRRGLTPALVGVFGIAVFVALTTLLHAAVSAERLMFLYQPEATGRVAFVSFLPNPNTLAGYMAVGAFSGLALLLRRRDLTLRPVVVSGVATCVGLLLLTGSRGGVAAFLLALLGFGVAVVRARGRSAASLAVVTLPLLLGFCVFAAGVTPFRLRDLLGDDMSKLGYLPRLVEAVLAFPLVGIGRGAFDSLSRRLFDEPSHITHSYVENFPLSWLLEWGVCVGLAGLALMLLFLAPRRLGLGRSRSRLAVLAALYALLAQNLLDLSLELPAIFGTFALLWGALSGSREMASSGALPSGSALASTPASGVGPRRLAWAPASFLTIWGALLALAALAGPSLHVERKQLRALGQESIERRQAAAGFEARLRVAMRRFPAEPYFPLVAAQWAEARNADSFPFAAAAVRLAPRSGEANLVLSSALARRGADGQALLHLRLAMQGVPRLTETAAERALAITREPNALLRTAPEGEVGGEFLASLVRRMGSQLSMAERRRFLREARRRAPQSLDVLSLSVAQLLLDPAPEELERAVQLVARIPDNVTCDRLRWEARILSLRGHSREAVLKLEACRACAVPTPCARERLDLALGTSDPSLVRTAEDAYAALACQDGPSCTEAHDLLAERAAKRGDYSSALRHLSAALSRSPSASRWLDVARASLALGQTLRATHAYETARVLGGRDDTLARQLREASP